MIASLETVIRRRYRKTYNWLYRVLMLEVGGAMAAHCSPRTAHRAADSIGWFLWRLPWNRHVRRSVRQAFPDGPADPAPIARRWLARPFRDHILVRA